MLGAYRCTVYRSPLGICCCCAQIFAIGALERVGAISIDGVDSPSSQVHILWDLSQEGHQDGWCRVLELVETLLGHLHIG